MISLNSCYCTHSDKPLQCSIDKPEYSCCEEFLNLKDHIRMWFEWINRQAELACIHSNCKLYICTGLENDWELKFCN